MSRFDRVTLKIEYVRLAGIETVGKETTPRPTRGQFRVFTFKIYDDVAPQTSKHPGFSLTNT